MSNIGVHDFAIPHEHVQPTRDMVLVRLPLPPKLVGTMIIPDAYRDLAIHNVMVGRVVAMGPLAFVYKDAGGNLARQPVCVGDWVIFRPYAGTQTIGGKVAGAGNWRYLSSFQDVIGLVPADKMPKPETLIWDESADKIDAAWPKQKPTDADRPEYRERIKVPNARS
jgi:co-chaperonin GroES (HSP10)